MRRPLTALAFSLAAGIVLAYYTEFTARHLCILCAGALFVMLAARRRIRFSPDAKERSAAALCCVCLLFFGAGLGRLDQASQ